MRDGPIVHKNKGYMYIHVLFSIFFIRYTISLTQKCVKQYIFYFYQTITTENNLYGKITSVKK